MELYIEKEFLDNFYLDYNQEMPSPIQKIIRTIFREYGEKKCFINYKVNSPEELELIKLDNPFFAELSTHFPPIEIDNIRDHYFEKSNAYQTLILTMKSHDWFEIAEERGAICMTFDNHEKIITQIIEKCHFKIDLSEGFAGWEAFNFFNDIPFNHILINDNYILVDKKNRQLMSDNIIPLLRNITKNKKEEVRIKIFSREFNPISSTDNHLKEAAKKKYNKLNRELASLPKKITIIKNDLQSDKFDLHDRVLISNYLTIDSGKGFNLIPHKKSNSQIVIASIFEKYTYNRIKNQTKIYDQYIKKFETMNSIKFQFYPA